jgi:hypothetical protein
MHKPTLAADVNCTGQVPRFDELPTGPLHASRLAAGHAFGNPQAGTRTVSSNAVRSHLGKGSSWKEEHGTR